MNKTHLHLEDAPPKQSGKGTVTMQSPVLFATNPLQPICNIFQQYIWNIYGQKFQKKENEENRFFGQKLVL